MEKPSRKTNLICKTMAANLLVQFWVIVRCYIDMFIDYVFSIYWDGKKVSIPPLDQRTKILCESATSLAKKIREKKLKSADLVAACIERIKAVNPIINAVTDERFAAALEEAREIDKQIESGLTEEEFKKKPYLGVPFTTKESTAVHGLYNTLGLICRKHLKAHEDSEIVRLLKEAGAIALAVSNVPEVNKWQETRNMLFGQTVNPFHTGRTVGGSSGGEGALVSSVASPIGLCSDIGGSTRMPAFYCGLFGHNPTAEVINMKGTSLRTGDEKNSMVSAGVVVKHAEDMAPLTKILAGEKAHLLKLDRAVNLEEIKFYYMEHTEDIRCSSVSPDLRKAMRSVVEKITSEVIKQSDNAPEEIECDGFHYTYRLWRYCMKKEPADFALLLANKVRRPNCLIELAKKLVGMSEYTLAAIVALVDDQLLPQEKPEWADSTLKQLKTELIEKLGDNGVLLFPSCSRPAPYHYSAFFRPYDFGYWGIFNALRFPATQVPLGLNTQGLPLGIQVVAAPYNDALCIEVAKYLEKAFHGFVPPCAVV